MKLEDLKNKKILILGFGKEGKDTLNFLSKVFPDKTFGVADKDKNCKLKIENLKLKKVKLHFGENYLEALKDYDLIIKSPGIPIHLPEIEEAFREGKITSQTEIFFENYKGKIVGITGTKGKSTTASLIYKILKEGKLNVKFGGNIGKPVLNYLISSKENEVFVYELSSHQLYNLKISPHIAVFLNIYPEHLDYYKDFNEYLMAKANITLWQRRNDFLIYNFKDKNLRKIANKSKAKKIPIKDYSKVLKQIGKLPFYGKFYGLNIACAIEVGKIFGINKEKMKKVIENFKPLPHRLEYVGKFKGIDFFNDSLSTIPQTTIAALDSLGEKVQTLILGGYNRGLSFKGLAKEIIKKKIKNLILFPDTGKIIWDEILKETKNKPRFENVFFIDNMKDAVKASFRVTQKNKICLLSPASPSFGIFKNYKERGDLFKKYIRIYGRNKRTKT
jgi:UDP-N-acetylmuramoylalanine--D-glutamate ligase